MLLVSLGKKEKEIKKQQVSATPRKNGKQCDLDVLVYRCVVAGLGKNKPYAYHWQC